MNFPYFNQLLFCRNSNGEDAKNVYLAFSDISSPTKNKTTAGLLALFLGGLGIHKFYLGFTGSGLVFLLVNTIGFFLTWILLFTPNIVLGIIALIEGIIYLTKTDEEFHQRYIVEKKNWF